jgi:hypothetical protein
MPCFCGDSECYSCGEAQGTRAPRPTITSEAEMLISVTYINETKGYILDEDPPHEPFTQDRKRLFRFAQKEWGRCVSKVYVDGADGKAIPCGWVFQRREKYDDARDNRPESFYVREVWVNFHSAPVTVTRLEHPMTEDR